MEKNVCESFHFISIFLFYCLIFVFNPLKNKIFLLLNFPFRLINFKVARMIRVSDTLYIGDETFITLIDGKILRYLELQAR